MKALHDLTASEAAREIGAGHLSSEALVSSCLEQVRHRETTVGAWIHLNPEQALAEARLRDQHPATGPLHGIPIGIKDIIDTADRPTCYGSPIYEGNRPAWDAACVALLRRAGAVMLGKTVTTEFACRTTGKTTNPHNPAHTPGGSSSGSAAAVAAAMVPLALGTQTSGSVIRPASYCGVLGYKASYGDLPLPGVKPLVVSLDTLGGFARSVEDFQRFRAALLGESAELALLNRSPKIGLCRTPQWSQTEPATRSALETAADKLSNAGAEVQGLQLPPEFDGLCDAQNTVFVVEGARCLCYELTENRELVSETLRGVLEPGFEISRFEELAARAVIQWCQRSLESVFADYDVLLTPSAPGEAPEGLVDTGNPVFNRMWTALGTPTVNLPGHQGPQGLPVGVQAVGRIGEDEQLLSVATWLESRIT